MVKSYRSWAEFEREEIRPSFKIGFSIDDFEQALGRDKYDDIEGDDFLDSPEDDDY